MRYIDPAMGLLLLQLLSAACPSAALADPAWHAYGAQSVGWTGGSHSGGLTLDGAALIGFHFVEVGASAQFATHIFGTMTVISALAGLGLALDRVRLGLWAECGGEFYRGVGSNFLTEDRGISALVPFVGGRASIAVRIAKIRTRASIWLGLTGIHGADLTSVRKTSVYTNDDNDVVRNQHSAGQTRWALLASVSASLDL